MGVLEEDENFMFLYNAANGNSNVKNSQIITYLSRFRKKLSFSWIAQFREETRKCLILVLKLIFKFTTNSDATIRVNAYNTLGGLLVTVAPFCPLIFIAAFAEAVSSAENSPKVSIAIINTFLYLTRFISPIRMNEFVCNIPVNSHFGVDLSEFIQFIPQVIPLMVNLPIALKQNILRSIICGCGKKPNFAFTSSVSLLVSMNKQEQIDILIDFIDKNQLYEAAVWLGPVLLEDKEVYELIGEKGRNIFLTVSLQEFRRKPLNLCQFENACKTCSIFLHYEPSLKEKIYNELEDNYPPIYQSRLLYLPMTLDKLQQYTETIYLSPKLVAIQNYFYDNNNDADEVAKLFYEYKDSENDLYCKLIECFGMCIDKMLILCKEDYHIKLMKLILEKENINWVHNEAVCKFIDNISVENCIKVFPEYSNIVLNLLLEFTLSAQDRLFSTAISSIKKFASYFNLEKIILRIYSSDWLNENEVSRRFYLLSELSELFHSNLFEMFIPIAYECLLYYENVSTISNIYSFLSKIKVTYISEEIRIFTFKFLIKHIQSFTQYQNDFNYDIEPLNGYFLDGIDTDIVTNPTINHQIVMEHVKNCYLFLCNLPLNLIKDIETFFKLSFNLVPIFDKIALIEMQKLANQFKQYSQQMFNLALDTFKSTSKDDVSAVCCQYLIPTNIKLPKKIEDALLQFITTKNTQDPDLLFYSFVYTDQKDHLLAINNIPNLIQRLPEKESITLLFKLSKIIGKNELKIVTENQYIAFLDYALIYKGEYFEKVKNYVQNIHINNWPLDDKLMKKSLVEFLEKIDFKIKLNNLDKIDLKHWKFIIKNKQFFDVSELNQFISEHISLFYKINITNIYQINDNTKKYIFNEIKDITKVSTIRTFVDSGEFVKENILLTNYFDYSNNKISDELFNKYLTYSLEIKSIKLLKSLLKYAQKFSISYNITDNSMFFTPEIIDYTLISLSKYKSIDNIPKNLLNKLEEYINKPITKEIIFDKDPSISRISKIDPTYFIHYLYEFEDFKANRLMKLIKIMNFVLFPTNELLGIIKHYIGLYNQLTSQKKKAIFLRFIYSSLVNLHIRKQKQSLNQLILILDEFFPIFIKDISSIIYLEISLLLQFLILYSNNLNVYNNFFNIINSKTFLFKYFLNHFTNLYITRAKQTTYSSLIIKNIKQIFNINLPSLNNIAFKSIKCFLNVEMFSYIKSILINEVPNNFSIYKNDFQIGPSIVYIYLTILTNNQMFDNVQLQIFFDIINNLFNNNKIPIYQISFPMIPKLSIFDINLFDNIFKLNFCNSLIINTIVNTFYSLQSQIKNTERLKTLQINTMKCFIDYYLKFPSIEGTKFLFNVVRLNNEPISFVFSKLVSETDNFVVLFVALKLIFDEFNAKQKEYAKSVIKKAEIKMLSRKMAMEYFLCDDVDVRKYFVIAAAESDNSDEISELSKII